MNNQPIISLCIPTNGVIEWVFPVLDSIYSQNVDSSLFEVVITDNGNNEDFYKLVLEYQKKVNNLFYYRSSGYEFLSEPDSYKNAKGQFIKFINHRTRLCEGALQYFIDWVNENKEQKSIVYFSNGVLGKESKEEYTSFDLFVRKLGYWSSWSTGMAFWKEDFDKLGDKTVYNFLFPHTTILFSQKNCSKYVIDDKILLSELPQGKIPKGKYNLFNAFGVEYMGIISDLLRNKDIALDTFLSIKKDNYRFLVKLFTNYVFLRKKCSYDLSDYEKSLNVYYSIKDIRRSCFVEILKRFLKFPFRCLRKFGTLIKG